MKRPSPRWRPLAVLAALAGCSDTTPEAAPTDLACDAAPVLRTTADGVEFVRTPDRCFDDLPGWPYAAQYVELDGLRQAYVDEGPADGPVVLLLHGQPSWSYLYRKMIPVLADGGFRVIAMDHLGTGRSDKPTDVDDYTYLGHMDRLERFIEQLGLRDINLFVQDWGSLIGLRVVGLHPEWFARVAVGNGALPVIPAGVQPFPTVEDPDVIEDIPSPYADIPPQQPSFYDGCDRRVPLDPTYFGGWMAYAMKGASFRASETVEAMTWFDLPDDEATAYDAPFPSRTYMAGIRKFPSIVNDLPGLNEDAWAGLQAFDKPFVTLWAANDPGNLGQCETQQQLIDNIPGAAGLPHDRLPEASHFLQDDQGPEIARRLVQFYAFEPLRPFGGGDRYCEILIVKPNGNQVEAEVWGTQGLNLCPAAAWAALDPSAIQAATGAIAVAMNGPRVWLTSSITGSLPSNERRTFGELEMRRLATVEINPTPTMAVPYEESTVLRNTTYTFDAGVELYELTAPDDTVYVMQSLSQIVDPSLTMADLSGLGARLQLPEGWTYTARTLETQLVMVADGEAFVLQDELQNTYQRLTATSTTGPGPGTLPVLDDGTGTPCASDADCAGLEASHCLSAQGQGFCTVEGCAAGACGAPYVCCGDCDPALAALLPFMGSACIPAPATGQLTSAAGCTCE